MKAGLKAHYASLTNGLNLQIGCAYRKADGRLAVIAKEWKGGGRLSDQWFFEDREGRGYFNNGRSLTGDTTYDLTDRAQEVMVGNNYDYHWPDKENVGHYTVTELTERGYMVVWDNNETIEIVYGSPLNYDAVLVSQPNDAPAVSIRSDNEPYQFTNGWSAKREYGDIKLPKNDGIGVSANSRWVLRNEQGEPVDMDEYRNNLFERYDLVKASAAESVRDVMIDEEHRADEDMQAGMLDMDPAGERLSGDDGYQA